MDLNEQGQRFSFAYVRAVASVAGFAAQEPETDDDSVDLTIAQRGGGGTIRSPRLDLQVKHSRQGEAASDPIAYDIKVKNYSDLRGDDVHVPRILVVVLVPSETSDWIEQDESRLAMRHCGYWASLREESETTNTASVTVHIPRSQQFTVAGLQDMMTQIGQGGAP